MVFTFTIEGDGRAYWFSNRNYLKHVYRFGASCKACWMVLTNATSAFWIALAKQFNPCLVPFVHELGISCKDVVDPTTPIKATERLQLFMVVTHIQSNTHTLMRPAWFDDAPGASKYFVMFDIGAAFPGGMPAYMEGYRVGVYAQLGKITLAFCDEFVYKHTDAAGLRLWDDERKDVPGDDDNREFYTCAYVKARHPSIMPDQVPFDTGVYNAHSDMFRRPMEFFYIHEFIEGRVAERTKERYLEMLSSEVPEDRPRIVGCDFNIQWAMNENAYSTWRAVRSELMTRFLWRTA